MNIMTLDERKQKILGAVVRDYIETVKPVGSEELASRYQSWGVKSATIRNELAELADLGFLRQPHTSAGRIPSDQGYRFYVDHLIVARKVRPNVASGMRDAEWLDLDRLLRQTCAHLTRLTSYTSVATPPRPADTHLEQILVNPAGDNRCLIVAVLSAGQVVNRLRSMGEILVSDLPAVTQALNAVFAGKTLDEINDPTSGNTVASAPADLTPSARAAFEVLGTTLRQLLQSAAQDENVYLDGTGEMLRQPEFRDITKFEVWLETVQRRTSLSQTLSRAFLGPDVTVVIGEENHVVAMQECSIVSASYFIGTRERGTIGVVGPTRMDYDRTVPAVSFFARSLSQMLTRTA